MFKSVSDNARRNLQVNIDDDHDYHCVVGAFVFILESKVE